MSDQTPIAPEYREILAVYTRAAEIAEALLTRTAATQDRSSADLISAYGKLNRDAGKLIKLLQHIQRYEPGLYAAWLRAIR